MARFQPLRQMSDILRNSSLVQWSTGVPAPEDLIAVPSCLFPGDASQAREYYSGRFKFYGELHETGGSSPFKMPATSKRWAAEIHGFCWLAHLRVAKNSIANSNAQTLVRDWIDNNGKDTSGIAWTVEVIAKRIIAWLTNASMIIENADQAFYSSFLHSIACQTRVLHLSISPGPVGVPQLLARAAIANSSLCLQVENEINQKKQISQAALALGQELTTQFLADGGHISRNPDAGVTAAAILLPLHQLYLQQQKEPPVQLTNTLDRILPMLDFFSHPDGSIAHFNGGGGVEKNLLKSVMAAGNQHGKPPENAAHSGYQRMQAGQTKLIIDTGQTPASKFSHDAHAGCLSFEMSSGSNILIANCGAAANSNFQLQQAARSTAAHSTAVLDDTSSCQMMKNYTPAAIDTALISPPVTIGIEHVAVERTTADSGEQVIASHDGYQKAFGMTHQRTIFLSTDGNTINGSDVFSKADESSQTPQTGTIAIRFHLHPDVKAEMASSGISVKLTLPDNQIWKFTCVDARIDIDDSIYFQPNMVPTKQIVLSAPLSAPTEIRWVIEQNPVSSQYQNPHSSQKSAPNDLLDIISKK